MLHVVFGCEPVTFRQLKFMGNHLKKIVFYIPAELIVKTYVQLYFKHISTIAAA